MEVKISLAGPVPLGKFRTTQSDESGEARYTINEYVCLFRSSAAGIGRDAPFASLYSLCL
jgi:hypothetical protein